MQSNYIPWKGYFDMINIVDYFVIYDTVQYTKNDWRNRNRIMTRDGPRWLTIPVRGENLHQRILDTKVAKPNWNVKHWKTLQSTYGRADFFFRYGERFQELYEGMTSAYLSEINLTFIKEFVEILEIKTPILRVQDLDIAGGNRNERLVQICQLLGAQRYLTGPAAGAYLDLGMFASAEIAVDWMSYENYPVYKQNSPDFDHHVSILDLLFHTGPEARSYMNS